MIGVLNSTCEWCKKEAENKYGEITYSQPKLLNCAIGKDTRLKQTDLGLIKTEEQYYILHSAGVGDGDTLNGNTVAVSEIKDLSGKTCFYKAVVLND